MPATPGRRQCRFAVGRYRRISRLHPGSAKLVIGGITLATIVISTGMSHSQVAGDATRGLALAREVCASCHGVLPTDARSPRSDAPTFVSVAHTPGITATALFAFLQTSHQNMPNIILEPDQIRDVTAYVLELR